MDKLIAMTKAITGKQYVPEERGWWQEEDVIRVPPGDEEGLLHELLHWIMATDAEREWPNLALDDDVESILPDLPQEDRDKMVYWSRETPDQREYQVCYLEHLIYQMRGQEIPRRSSCGSFLSDPDPEGTRAWCEERLAPYGGLAFLRQVASVLETFSFDH